MLRYTQPDWPKDKVFELWEQSGVARVLDAGDSVWGSLSKPGGAIVTRQCTVVSAGGGTAPARVSFPFQAADFTSAGDYVLELDHRFADGRDERNVEPVIIYIRPTYAKGRR